MVLTQEQMPHLQPIPKLKHGDRREWLITKDWFYQLSTGHEIMIPSGFVFDGASTPRGTWNLFQPVGILFIPAIIHDFAYVHGYLLGIKRYKENDFDVIQEYWLHEEYTRDDWDKLFRDEAKRINPDSQRLCDLAYLALKVGAGPSWRKRVRERR